MGAKHNKCCCVSPVESLIIGSRKNTSGFSRVYRYDLDGVLTGTLWDESTGTSPTGTQGLACDSSGNIYVATGGSNKVVSLDPDGAERWTYTDPSFAGVLTVAVDAFGNVYSGNGAGVIRKLDASTGTQITTGWPQSASPAYGTPKLAVDQSGNVYLNCGRPGGGAASNLLSWDSSGSSRWAVTIGNNNGAASGIAINAANTQMVACRQYVGAFPADTEFVINPASGATLSSTRVTAATSDHSGAAYDKDGNRFVNALGVVYKNSVALADLTTFNTGMTCDRTSGNIYVTTNKPPAVPRYSVQARSSAGAFVWGIDPNGTEYPGTALALEAESSLGRIGAFGL